MLRWCMTEQLPMPIPEMNDWAVISLCRRGKFKGFVGDRRLMPFKVTR
jgi:hypothetical protein